ncbi:hypothetical protein HK098_007599 [Nowakowskiella sp. JEL0407]|nr:hypothetical protein HK098_007599 [Nowakowskiella sp. JEL0407]
MPRSSIPDFSYLTKSELPLLKKMKQVGEETIANLKSSDPSLSNMEFKIGFHSVPSMRQLHLHVISTDMSSESLKNKKHWNSFTTEFFVPFDDFFEKLEMNGNVKFDEDAREELLKGQMKCHVCGSLLKDMREVRKHVDMHF